MQPERSPYLVSPERLRARCEPNSFTFENTASLSPPPRMVGQERAAEALEFGLGVPDSHYNIFVAGPPGSGRSVSAEDIVRRVAASMPVPDDWCYVYNFAQQYVPRALALPPGRARPFAKQVGELIESTRQALSDAFDTDQYRQQRSHLLQTLDAERDAIIEQLNAAAAEHGFAIQPGEGEPNFLPLKPRETPDAALEPYSREEFEALPNAEKERINREYQVVQELYAGALSQGRRLGQRVRDEVRKFERGVAKDAVFPLFEPVRAQFVALPAAAEYLDAMRDDIIANSDRVRGDGDSPGTSDDDTPGGSDPAATATAAPSYLARYKVNVIVDRTGQQGAPFINEHNPTYYNVAGKLEYGQVQGNLYTDFSFIRAGALHQANGGFLIIHVKEMMTNPKAWDAIKRALRSGQATIENLVDQQQAALVAASLKPEPIPLSVKVVLLGGYGEWDALNDDPDFDELFKVRADFDDEMPRNAQTEYFYAQFTGDVARELHLPPLDRAAVARLVEQGSRMADDQTHLSAVLTDVRELVIEAGYWAKRFGSPAITVQYVDQALLTRRRRISLIAEKYYEQVRLGRQIIATSGTAVGQINALSLVTGLGIVIGQVMRITARVAPGVEGIVAIEREAQISGPIHNKGVLILGGYLRGQFGQNEPLSLAASLAFEQVYSPVDGDSASVAELMALLSALAEIPIAQNLAITGSINQWGDVQPIGGVSQKIEGFFQVCQANPVSGVRQGVIIPEANVRNLMLRLDVLEAVREGRFAIYAVTHISQAVELLMGRPAGSRAQDGSYLAGTVNALVSEKLHAYADRVRRYRNYTG